MLAAHVIALADVGLPMIIIAWPLMILALVPVIVVEALLIRRWVPLSEREAFKGIAAANAVSTAVGVPLAWLVMFAAQMAIGLPMALVADKFNWNPKGPLFDVVAIIMSSAWIEDQGDNNIWVIAVSMAVLLIPCFYLSVWIERRVCRRIWKNADAAQVRLGVYRANLASYVLLFTLACALAGFAYYARKS